MLYSETMLAINFRTRVVYVRGNILSFHIFDYNDNFERIIFSQLNYCTLSNIRIVFRTGQGLARPPGQSAQWPPVTHSDDMSKVRRFNLRIEQNVNGCHVRNVFVRNYLMLMSY